MQKQSLKECIEKFLDDFGYIRQDDFVNYLVGWLKQAIKSKTVDLKK
jgi:hypothetical protein